MPTQYFRKAQVAARYSTTKRTVDRMVADGRLPPPDFHLGDKIPLWSDERLDESDRQAMARGRQALMARGHQKHSDNLKAQTPPG